VPEAPLVQCHGGRRPRLEWAGPADEIVGGEGISRPGGCRCPFHLEDVENPLLRTFEVCPAGMGLHVVEARS
jgi:hypothetical protein